MRRLRPVRLDQRGFSLAELLVSMAIVGLALAGIVTFLTSGSQAYLTGSNQIAAQEAARVALERMAREIRGAGYNPRNLPPCSQPSPCLDPIVGPPTLFAGPTATGLTIQMDTNANGALDVGERIAYTLSGTTLERQVIGVDAAPQPVTGGVEALTFDYFDAAGNAIAVPVPAASVPNIHSVQIRITTQPENPPASWTTGRVSVVMGVEARIRNR